MTHINRQSIISPKTLFGFLFIIFIASFFLCCGSNGSGTIDDKNNSPTDDSQNKLDDSDDSDGSDGLTQSVSQLSQYGITWTFSKPVSSGQFVNGDYWIVGPVDIIGISPAPANGRNGSAIDLNVAGTDYTIGKACWDNRIVQGRYDPVNLVTLPLTIQPGQSLISTVSLDEIGSLSKMLRDGPTDVPTRTAAVLTCLGEPAPSDAFRPGYADPDHILYRSRDLRRELLPNLPVPPSKPDISEFERYLQRPWIDTAYDEFTAPLENMPIYGREYTRIVSMSALMLCLDLPADEKETLLIRMVQLGIDLRGLMNAGYLGWPAVGGHGNGRKLPLLFAGLLLNEDDMCRPGLFFPNVKFSEDIQTMYDSCWTGANVVFAGHAGALGHPNKIDWGAYEHLHPSQWPGTTGETYRRCCTSIGWVGEATAAKLLGLKTIWNHDAFFDYVERWMTEDDTEFAKIATQETGVDFTREWQAQGQAWDAFVEDMWSLYWYD